MPRRRPGGDGRDWLLVKQRSTAKAVGGVLNRTRAGCLSRRTAPHWPAMHPVRPLIATGTDLNDLQGALEGRSSSPNDYAQRQPWRDRTESFPSFITSKTLNTKPRPKPSAVLCFEWLHATGMVDRHFGYAEQPQNLLPALTPF